MWVRAYACVCYITNCYIPHLYVENKVPLGFFKMCINCVDFICFMPRPHPLQGKRSLVNLDTILGPGKGIWAFQWDCSFSTVIWHANHRNAICHYLLYKFESAAHAMQHCWPIRSKVCFSTAVAACADWASQTKKTVQIHQTPFPSQRVRD